MFNAFLKIAGVESEATQKGFEKQIKLESFHMGASNPVDMSAGGGRGAGRATLTTFDITKMTDKSSPVLFQACCLGKHFKDAVVSICKAGGEQEAFLTYKFDTVFIADISWGAGSEGADTPEESLSLAYTKVEMTHLSQDREGKLGDPIVASYDIETATGG
jgi:type VI secretion system secreted protein Hcp